ncbi:MAG: carboxypeptidase regulatory-like domain-containing protein, partial [Pirellulales bacterium]
MQGRVLGPEGRPLAGASFYLNVDEWTEPVELGTSDADGGYRFTVPEQSLRRSLAPSFTHANCQASLIATAHGLGPGWVELPSINGTRMGEMKPEYAHDFHLAADFPIAGTAIDAAGMPVAGAVVTVDGMFELADRRWWKMQRAIDTGDLHLMGRDEIDPNNWFSPLYRTAWKMISATTDADGRFRLTGVGADRAVRLHVDGPGIRPATVSVLTRDDVDHFTKAVRSEYPRTSRAGDSQRNVGVQLFGPSPSIEVERAPTIGGVVRDAATGEPVAGITVFYNGTGAPTDRRGRYHRLLAEGNSDHEVWVLGDRSGSPYVNALRRFPGTDAPARKRPAEIIADFDLPPGVVVTGRVLESGTDRPIVAAPRRQCHDPESGGPLLAGYVLYFPLSTNLLLRGTANGLYFEGLPVYPPQHLSREIGGDGGFRITVPPGPGVLLVQAWPGLPMFAESGTWKESEGLHRLFPYAPLTARAKDDGAPEGDAQSLPGFTAPIPLSSYHAYRVIDPPADATTLDLTLTIPRAPSRTLRFVDPDGQAIRG